MDPPRAGPAAVHVRPASCRLLARANDRPRSRDSGAVGGERAAPRFDGYHGIRIQELLIDTLDGETMVRILFIVPFAPLRLRLKKCHIIRQVGTSSLSYLYRRRARAAGGDQLCAQAPGAGWAGWARRGGCGAASWAPTPCARGACTHTAPCRRRACSAQAAPARAVRLCVPPCVSPPSPLGD